MPVIVGSAEWLEELAAVLVLFAGARRVGLYQNDWTMRHDSVIGQVVPATFSGYAGLQALTGWTAPALLNDQAVSNADPATWTRGAGSVNNWIFGYYVVDAAGVLRWAERDPNGPVAIVVAGNTYRVTPQFSLGSRY